jgi:hypothetical protein
MINRKVCHAFLCVMEKEGKRANYWRDRERMSERQSILREGGCVRTKINILPKHVMEMQSDKQDERCQ